MNILLTSAGRRGYLVCYFKEALAGNGKVFAGNNQDSVTSFRYADEYVITPLIYSDDYIPFLLQYCKEKSIDVIIPLFDVDLYPLAVNKERFSKIGVTVVVSSSEFITICNDKWKTYKFLVENGFNTPKTYLTQDSVTAALNKGEISFPLITKPRWGMGSIGVNLVINDDELKVFTDKTRRTIEKTYLKYESNADKENCVLIQEALVGDEYGLDVINDLKGNYCSTSVKKKIMMRAGETDGAETVDSTVMTDLGKKLAGLSRHIGNLDIDAFLVDGKLYILEMNARFGGGYPFSHIAGVNLPLAIVKWLNGEEVSNSLLTPKVGIVGQKDISVIELLKK